MKWIRVPTLEVYRNIAVSFESIDSSQEFHGMEFDSAGKYLH